MRLSALALSAVLLSASALADAPKPTVASLFYAGLQDHAVLQRDRSIPVWGTAKPGATVTVRLGASSASAKADSTGAWKASLPAMSAGGPYTLEAESSDGAVQTLKDILIGDVFLCSGQSNMEMQVRYASNYNADIREATNTQIRLFHVQRSPNPTPQSGFGGGAEWAVTSPQSVAEFSASCYNFGKNLQPAIGVPVGLIEDAWGGSVIETWISEAGLQKLGGYDGELDLLKTYRADASAGVMQWQQKAIDWWKKRDPALSGQTTWADPAFDDSHWDSIAVSGSWRVWNVPALKTFNGAVWLRQSFDLTEAQAAGAAALSLGTADAVDVAWVNGVAVGAGQGYDIPRHYTVPKGVLHAGRNVLAWGIVGGAGPLVHGGQMNIKTADGSALSFAAPWRYKLSAGIDTFGPAPAQPWLNQFGRTVLYNGMIHPLQNTPVKAIIWYQGESNSGAAKEYARLLPALIADWRGQFGADTPFVVVQLPNFGPFKVKAEKSDWADLREAQRQSVLKTPNTGLVVTIDIGQVDNIHPTNKQEVGRRIALKMQKLVYGQAVVDSGPTPAGITRKGNTLTLRFDHTDQGLLAYAASRPLGFQLCAGENACRYVDAVQKGETVSLNIPAGFKADAVRYCWADSPVCNVFNGAGLPAVPFSLAVPVK